MDRPGQDAAFESLRLKDGRLLSYGIFGRRDALPVFDFHGIPGSRLEAGLMASFLGRDDVCFIGVDRPGYGGSSFRSGYGLADFPADVAALADCLGIRRFAVMGYSGGGPYALACGWKIPERIAALAVVSGVGPVNSGSAGMHESNRKKFDLAQRAPWLARLLLRGAFTRLRLNPARMAEELRRIWQQMPDPDREALRDDRFANGILDVTRDAIRMTVDGWVNEELMVAQPWPFRLQDVRCDPCYLWHGEEDRNVPLAMGQAVAAGLPGCQARFVPGEGHLSLLYRRGHEIVDTLVQAYHAQR